MQSLARRLSNADLRDWPDRPVPVTLVITELDVGGAERALVALATGLDRRHWLPTVIALGPEGPLAAPLRDAGIAVTCLGVDPRNPIGAVARLAGALRSIRPAVVQSFLFHANVAARLAAPFAGRPPVIGGLRVAERRKGWHRALDRLTIGLSIGSVCVSEGVRDFSLGTGRLPADRLTVIPNGVDPAPFDRAMPLDRASLSVPTSAHLALFVGRLDRQKGVASLLDAAARVARERDDWFLALAGDGPEHDDLHARAGQHPGLSARLRWLGRRDDVPALLGAADLLVLPSLWEGMPNVVLEAMAARRAVVATSVPGSAELVEPGRTGWLVPPGDPEPLARALLDAASDPDRLRRLGEAGRARVEAEFTPERAVAAYERLWAGVLGLDLNTAP